MFKPAQILAKPLEQQILGEKFNLDLYARNPFRLIKAAASEKRAQLSIQKIDFNQLYQLAPKDALDRSIKLGYEKYLDFDDALNHVNQLDNPRKRLLWEIFWLHLPKDSFNLIKNTGNLTDQSVLDNIAKIAESSTDLTKVLFMHALAIIYHNLAIAQEIEFIQHFETQKTLNNNDDWQKALHYWAQTLKSELFWGYIIGRRKLLDDPCLRISDIKDLRSQLHRLIPSFNEVFINLYLSHTELSHASYRHQKLIAQFAIAIYADESMTVAIAEKITNGKLNQLIQKIDKELQPQISYQEFTAISQPVLEDIDHFIDSLPHEFGFHPGIIKQIKLDQLAEKLLEVTNQIDYQGQDRQRALLCRLLTAKRLLKWPLASSSTIKAKIEQSFKQDIHSLYSIGDLKPNQFDPTQCWFAPDLEADPESSILMIVAVQGTKERQILVPRSKLAYQIHHKIRERESEEALKKLKSEAAEENERMQARIDRRQKRSQKLIHRLKFQRDAKIDKATMPIERRLSVYDRRISQAERSNKEAIAQCHIQFDKTIESLKTERELAIENTQKQWQNEKQKVQTHLQHTLGLRRFASLDLPLILILMGGLTMVGITPQFKIIVADFVWIESILRDYLNIADRGIEKLPLIFGSLIGLIVALLSDLQFRFLRSRGLKQALDFTIPLKLKEEINEIERQAWIKTTEEKGKFETSIANNQAKLAKIEKVRNAFQQDIDDVKKKLTELYSLRISKRRRKDDAYISKLELKIKSFEIQDEQYKWELSHELNLMAKTLLAKAD